MCNLDCNSKIDKNFFQSGMIYKKHQVYITLLRRSLSLAMDKRCMETNLLYAWTSQKSSTSMSEVPSDQISPRLVQLNRARKPKR